MLVSTIPHVDTRLLILPSSGSVALNPGSTNTEPRAILIVPEPLSVIEGSHPVVTLIVRFLLAEFPA